MATLSDLIVKLGIDATNFTGQLDTAMGKLDAFGGKAMKAGGILTGALTVPLVGIGAAAFEAARKFDEASDQIRAGTGATGDALKSLESSFKTVFEAVPASAEQVATAITDLNARLGLSGKPLEDMATQMLNLARLTKSEVGPLIADTTRVFGDWAIASNKQSEALDFLYRVTQQTGVGINALSQQVVHFGAPLRQMGFDFETAAALVGKFEKEGVNAELVFGSMRIALTRMAKEGVTDAGTALQIITERIKNAGSAGEANALALETFGSRAGPDMAAAIREGRFSIDELVNSLITSQETINKAADATRSWDEKWGQFKNQLIIALVPLGTTLINALSSILQYSQPFIEMLKSGAEWFSKLDPAIQTVGIAIGALAAAIGPLLVIIGGMASGLSAILGVVGGGAGLTAVLGVLWPIVAAIAAAWATWELAKWLSGFEPVKAAIDFLLGGLQKLWEWILKIPGAKALVDKATEGFNDLKEKVSDLTKGTGKAEDAAKDHEKQLKSLAVGSSSAVGKSIKSFDDMTESVKLLTVKHDAQKDALFKLGIETIKARQATEDWNRGLITIKGTTIDYIREAEDMVDRIGEIESATRSLKDMAGPAFGSLSGGIQEAADRIATLDDSYKTLGQTSKDESDKIIAKANAARDAILGDENADEFAKKTAVYKALKIQVEQATLMGQEVPRKTKDALTAMESELKINLPEKFENPWKNSIQAVSTNITNAAQSIVGILIGTEDGTVADALKKLGQSVLTSFTEPALAAFNKFITEGIKAAINWLIGGGGLTDALGKVGGKISDVFSGGGAPSGGGGGIPTGGGAPAPSPDEGGGGGVPGGGGGGGMQDPLAWVNAAANVVSAIYNVRTEGTLNAIEENTRFGMIHSLGQLLQANEYWPKLNMIYSALETFVNTQAYRLHDIANYLQNIVEQHIFRLQDINNATWETVALIRDVTNVHLAAIRDSVAVLPQAFAGAAAGAGGSQTIVVQNILDSRIMSETVIDNMGRQLNQSGQILR